MKKFILLILMCSSFMAVACGENEIDSIGGPVTDGKGSVQTNSGLSASSSGLVGTDCIELPPIKAVITYITFAPNWLGGAVGIAFALNYAGAGGGIGVLTNIHWSNITGCTTSTQSERQLDARKIYNAMNVKMQLQAATADDPSPELTTAERWLEVNSDGRLFKVSYPDGSNGYFRIDLFRPVGFEQESCG